MCSYIISTVLLTYFSQILCVNVSVNTKTPIHTIPDRFLSIAFDVGHAWHDNWDGINFTFIQPLAKALGPSYFRFGGTDADDVFFQENQTFNAEESLMNPSSLKFSAIKLDQLYNFANNVGWRLIFDLNLMLRSDGEWNSSNAQQLIDYANQHDYEMDFELGNEPDSFHLSDQFNMTINGSQIADDYGVLRNLLNSYNLYKNSIIIGPSVSSYGKLIAQELTQDFLNNNGGDYIGGLSFHFYYFPGDTATIDDFLSYKNMDKFLNITNDIKELNYSHIWIGESASAFNGGAANMSDAFVDGFIYLDMLGLAALQGIEVVVRQQLHGGNYAILDDSMYPYHDYWVALTHKKIIGKQVFNLSVDVTDLNLRLYAASSKNINNGIVVYGVRISNESVTLDFPQFSTRKATVYILKEGESGNLESRTSKLNDQLLEWNPHQPGANYQGILTNLPITIPSYSQFFIVVDPNTETSCPNGWHKETVISNKCVKVIKETQPLFGAKIDCSTYGNNASILSIDNAFENSEIYKEARSQGCKQFYIGLTRNGTSWTWSNGDSSNYHNWKNGYPTSDNTKNCVSLDTTSGTWSNEDCDSFHCYICQKYV